MKVYTNTTIEELLKKEMLSTRTFNVCLYNDLLDLEMIYEYYKQNGTFKHLRNCGNQTESELIKLSISYKEYFETIKNKQLNIQVNYTIEELRNKEILSTRTFNVCYYNDLLDLEMIYEYYKQNGTFKHLRNCGNQTESELIKLSISYKEYFETIKNKQLNIQVNCTIEELWNKEILSTRVYNICYFNNLLDIEMIYEYYTQKGTFKNLRNSVTQVDFELIKLCKLYKDGTDIKNPLFEINNLTYNDLVNEMSDFKSIIMSNYYSYLISKLSYKAKYRLINILKTDNNFLQFFKNIIEENFNFSTIKSIRNETVKELTDLKINFNKFLVLIFFNDDTELKHEATKAIILNNYGKLPHKFEQTLISKNSINIILLLDLLIVQNIMFGGKKKKVFEKYFIGYNNPKKNKHDNIKLTNERIRQLRILMIKELNDFFFVIIKNYGSFDLEIFAIEENKLYHVINEEYIISVNKKHNVCFNKEFYDILLSTVLIKEYKEVKIDSLNLPKKSTYLIQKNIFNIFDWFAFLYEINNTLKQKRKDNYSLSLSVFIDNFFKLPCELELYNKIIEVVKTILVDEFNLVIANDKITFSKNAPKFLIDYCLEALNEINSTATIFDIHSFIENKYPLFITTEESIRNTLIRNSQTFISIGRQNTYGLRKWENEKPNIKGGSIRNIVIEFLEQNDSPQHIMTITNHLLEFRPKTYERSVLDNIKAIKNDVFVFFPGKFIGLKTKKYDEKSTNHKDILGIRFTLNYLKRFNFWDYDDFVNFYIQKYSYTRVQIEFVIKQKIQKGVLIINSENKIVINYLPNNPNPTLFQL